MLLLAAASSCSLYRKVHHPYRLPTPKPSPEYLAQQKKKKADEKVRNDLAKAADSERRKSGAALEEGATDISTPSRGNGAVASTGEAVPRELPEKSTVKYDKHGIMKKPRLKRRQWPNYGPPNRPIQAIRNFFRYGFHAKPNYDPKHRPAPKQPAEPTPEPDAAPADKP